MGTDTRNLSTADQGKYFFMPSGLGFIRCGSNRLPGYPVGCSTIRAAISACGGRGAWFRCVERSKRSGSI